MSLKIACIKKENTLVPTEVNDPQGWEKLKQGQEYLIEVKQSRNVGLHRKFFALLKLVFNNQEQHTDFDDFRAIFTMKLGYFKRITTEKGEVYIPKSISFGSMDNITFSELFEKALVLAYEIIGVDPETLRSEVDQFNH